MLASNLFALAGIVALVAAVAELTGWKVALLVLAVVLLLIAYALYTQAAAGSAPEPDEPLPPATG